MVQELYVTDSQGRDALLHVLFNPTDRVQWRFRREHWGIGKGAWIGASDDESCKALHRSIDLGLNFIDTALAYGLRNDLRRNENSAKE